MKPITHLDTHRVLYAGRQATRGIVHAIPDTQPYRPLCGKRIKVSFDARFHPTMTWEQHLAWEHPDVPLMVTEFNRKFREEHPDDGICLQCKALAARS